MGVNVQQRGAGHQLRVTHRLLPKPYFRTFDSEPEARDFGNQLAALLARGIVPSELLAPAAGGPAGNDPVLTALIRDYLNLAPVTESDVELLARIAEEVPGVRVSGVTMKWAEQYVASLKRPDGRGKGTPHLAPGSIRKRVGALGRVLDWHFGREARAGTAPAVNVLRLMPPAYSLYTEAEAQALRSAGEEPKADEARDRRLSPDEELRVRVALAGERRPGRERPLTVDPEFTMLFDLILDTGMRLSEAFRLRVEQVDVSRRLIHVEGSKGARGALKPRTVPIKKALLDRLAPYVAARPAAGLMFSFWDGTKEGRVRASSKLSNRFGGLFAYAQVDGMTEHDLRHEATCRWFELRDPRGAWVFSDIEICRIMGWSSTDMALRYASLRGEDLAARLDF